jgi:hypothetical protein
MRAGLLLLLVIALGAGEAADPYAAWWRRADAALVAGRSAPGLDAPPEAAGGEALLHHRLLVAWLAGDGEVRGRIGGLLERVRARCHAAVSILDPAIACTSVPGAGDARWVVEGAGGPPLWRDRLVAAASAGGAKALEDVLEGWFDHELTWRSQIPEVARERTKLTQAPPEVPQREREAVIFAMLVMAEGGVWPAYETWRSPAGQVLRYRLRRDCGPAWARVGDYISEGTRSLQGGELGVRASVGRIFPLAEAVRRCGPSARAALPALADWAQRRLAEREIGWTWQVGAAVDLIRASLDDPAGAEARERLARRHVEDFLASLPQLPEPEVDDTTWLRVYRVVTGAGETVTWLGAAARMLETWAQGNHALGLPLSAWSTEQVGEASARLDALVAAGPDEISLPDAGLAWKSAPPGADIFAPVREVISAARQALAARAAELAQPEVGTRRAARARALVELAQAHAQLAAMLPGAATVIARAGQAMPLPAPPRHLALGEAAAPPPTGWSEGDLGAATAALRAASAGGWAPITAHLIASHAVHGDPLAVAASWRRLLRRHALFAELAATRHPDLPAVATGPLSVHLVAVAVPGSQPPPREAVAAWLRAIGRPVAGSVRPASAPTRSQLIDAWRAGLCDLPRWWIVLGNWVDEGDVRQRLATIELLTALPMRDARDRAVAEAFAPWAECWQHTVAWGLASAAAHGWEGRDAFLAAARNLVASLEATP